MPDHPYPSSLISDYRLADGTDITIRPIRPDDAVIEDRFVRELSAQAKYFRFMRGFNKLSGDMLARFTRLDYVHELALVATLNGADGETFLGVARYVMSPDERSGEFALVVADAWQHKGIGSQLMKALMKAARARGIKALYGDILASNRNMLDLMRSLEFTIHAHPEDPNLKVARRTL